jgi:hypothetical protein
VALNLLPARNKEPAPVVKLSKSNSEQSSFRKGKTIPELAARVIGGYTFIDSLAPQRERGERARERGC